MRENSILLKILKFIYFILVLVAAIFVVSRFSNGDNADMSSPMPGATLPVVSLKSMGREMNLMHGYTSEVDISYLRGNIMPIGSNREVTYKVNTFGGAASNLSFEVRSIDGGSLVENQQIQD